MKRKTLKCGIVPHPRENEDLRQIYFILTYACNKACPYCIEPNVHSGKFLSEERLVSAMQVAKELDMKILYLHGGEPTTHHDIVRYAKIAKSEGFRIHMFTNGILMDVVRKLDGIVDEIRFSYEPGAEFMLMPQADWQSTIKLYIMATTVNYPSEANLMHVVDKALTLGMGVKVRTLNPVNQFAYNYQFVPYLHNRLLQIPFDDIFCDGNKAAITLKENVIVRLGNMQLNPGHLKYSVDPDGNIHDRFLHTDMENIIPNPEIEAQKAVFEPLVEQLKNL